MRTGKVSKKVGQREQLILALLQQPSRGLDRHFDGDRVAYFQNEGVQGRIQKRAMGGSLTVIGSPSASFGRSRLGASQSDDRKTTPAASRVRAADRVLDHASRATALEDIEARITELERAANPAGEGSEGE